MLKTSHLPLAALLVGFSVLALSGCNTVSGVGKDLTALGSAMTNAAEEAKDEDAPRRGRSQGAQRGSQTAQRTPSGPR